MPLYKLPGLIVFARNRRYHGVVDDDCDAGARDAADASSRVYLSDVVQVLYTCT